MRTLLQTLQDQDIGFLRVVAEQWGLEVPQVSPRELPLSLGRLMLSEGAFEEQVEGLPPETHHALDRIEGMGGGDVKLMAMIGAFLGWQMVFPVLFIASLFGSMYGLFLITRGGTGTTAVAFGSFLAPSAIVVLLVGQRLWSLYLGL